jgi:hypothetical protein
MTSVLDSVLVSIGHKATGDGVAFMHWVMGPGSANIITQTPPGLSYSNGAVVGLWHTLRTAANVGLAVVTVWGGVNLMVNPVIRAPYHGALELVPRVLLSGILINTSLDWGHFVIDLNNAICEALGSTAMPAWSSVVSPNAGSALLDLIAIAIYLVMALLLLGQMLMRLALLDALLVIGPLALLCWVVPQTYGWARLWFNTFFGTVFVQSIQVLVLQLGTQLILSLPPLLPSLGSDPIDAWRLWLLTLFLGVAVLQLARKVPRLMPGFSGGGSPGGGSVNLGSLRQISALIRGSSSGKGGK